VFTQFLARGSVLLLFALAGPAAALAAAPKAPNLLVLIADDHRGGTLGADGDPRRATPRLDALAKQGVRFTHAYCNAPVCTASRQSLITGRMPHAVGVTLLTTPLPDRAVTLGEWLGDRGYETAAVGKMHFNGPSRHGFATRIDRDEWAAWLKEHPPAGGDQRHPWRPFQVPASEWLNAACRTAGLPAESMESAFYAGQAAEFLKRPRERPFFLVVSFYDPHSPFRFPREWEGRFDPAGFPVKPVSRADLGEQPRVFRDLTDREKQGIQAAYYSSLSFLDHEVGRVLDALDGSGQAGNTVVVYLGDNGYMLGEHGRFEKHCFYEPAVRVPLLVRWTGRLPEGRTVDDLVAFVDVAPTVLDLLGVEKMPDLHGRSLVPLLNGEPGAKGREYVVSEYLENEEAMVRSSRYKLIVGTGRRQRTEGYETGLPLTGPYERLYDEQADPGETTNLADRPEMAGVKAELLHQLYLRLVSTRDGAAPVPPWLTEAEAVHWCLIPRDTRPERSR
jgi:choline-sulfatase